VVLATTNFPRVWAPEPTTARLSAAGAKVSLMSPTKPLNRALDQLLNEQCDIVTRPQVLACGLSDNQLRSRVRPGGPWKIILPGIYLAHNGLLTVGQREIVASLHAGSGAVISGRAALARQGVRVPQSDLVDVLIPHDRIRLSTEFVKVHRTKRMPAKVWRTDGLLWAPAARAVADAVRGQTDLRAVRAVVADAVQRQKCTVEQLIAELRASPSQGSAALRVALEEVAAGADSVAEAEFIALIKASGLPDPMYNPRLYLGSEFLAKPDVWWPTASVAAEVDSLEWHFSPAGWSRTVVRHERMTAHGLLVLHFSPNRIRTEPREVIHSLRSAVEAGLQRPPLPIRAIPSR
jgi:hypothetical protein